LAGLEAQHTAAVAAGKRSTAGRVRLDARKLAASLGVAVPAFAALTRPAKTKAPAPPKPKPQALKMPVAEQPTEPFAVTSFGGVRAWAQAAPVGGRALSFRTDGSVTLIAWHAGDRQEAHFMSEALALEAITAGRIPWRVLHALKSPSWRGARAPTP